MLSKNELEKIAEFTRLKLHQQEKHYVQTIVLSSIYSVVSDELVFKGGTALFFIRGLNRFSEDLDFTALRVIDKNKLIETIKRNLELVGLKSRIEKIKENKISLSFRIGAEGPLFTRDIERCYVYVDISKRERIEKYEVKEIRPQYTDLLPFNLVVMNSEEVGAEKARAVLTRNYARDVYDLWFLLKSDIKIDLDLINRKLAYYNLKFDKKGFAKQINRKRDIWKTELRPIVIGTLPEFGVVKKFIDLKFGL